MIYTLYSFKGGVGRSMALANLAECFFQKGLRVLMIDWDLEAPGLENYFYSPASLDNSDSELGRASSQRGLIDMLVEYKEKFPEIARQMQPGPEIAARVGGTDPVRSQEDGIDSKKRAEQMRQVAQITTEFFQSLSDIPDDLRRVDFPVAEKASVFRSLGFEDLLEVNLKPIEQYLQTIHKSGSSELRLLSAGARTPDSFASYAAAVQDFDWLEFLAGYSGREYLEWFRRKLLSLADVVLIDSRTGVTEMGGVCTRQMPDAVISFCAPNFQNLAGVATIVGSLDTDSARKARYDRALEVLVIPTRIDDFESGLLDQFSKQFSVQIEHDPFIPEVLQQSDRPLWNLQIPYIPKYNYREQRVIGPGAASPDPASAKLVKAYTNIALHLAVLAPSSSPIRLAFASEIASAFPYLAPANPPRMAPPLPTSWVERDEELAKLRTALLESLKAPTSGCVALWGEAGVGKTSLAARVCQDEAILQAFPDGIVWLTLDRPWDEDRLLDWLRSCFSLPRKGGAAALEAVLQNRHFLFVVDDVWSPEQLDAILRFRKSSTQLVLTRDLGTASMIANPVITVPMLTPGQSKLLLSNNPSYPVGKNDELDLLLRWPLGASLLRADLERRGARGQSGEDAWIEVQKAIENHGITAFDQVTASNRNGSIAQSIRETVGRLRQEERDMLTDMAKAAGGLPLSANLTRDRRVQRLTNLGLIKTSNSLAIVQPAARGWLSSQGEIDGHGQRGKKVVRQLIINQGYEIVRGRAAELSEMLDLAEKAKDLRSFSLARRLFGLALRHPDAAKLDRAKRLKLIQRQSLCTYKDDDVPSKERFSRAIEILQVGDLGDPNPSQESLGLAGAIYKGLWKLTGRRTDLERSLSFYQWGTKGEFTGDFGYTRINAAFVLDLLASQESDSEGTAKSRRQEAAKLRDEIVTTLPDLASQNRYAFLKWEWWYGATLAEACFGLGRHAEATYWIREALALEPPDWQLESTARQMVALAWAQGVRGGNDSPQWQTLGILVGDATPAIQAIVAGKVGLALSGGGFRASLFHVGVLARLAELDVLRHVEVLSCVSGGSIIGAHYYLEVRRLLESKPDREITREDYIEIVKRIEDEFLAGVQKDLRNRLFAGWFANLRSLFEPAYTRTQYLGELFERYFYAPLIGKPGAVWLNELRINPKEGGEEFNPRLDNWRRSAKAPILLLNATTLNTGHNWQFAVSWMGEPPMGAGGDVDSNDLLRRMYYSEAPVKHKRVRLGLAVAASACVPLLFDPIELRNLYPRRTVRLVDGGVHDNQGTAGLLEQECSIVIVSDASGQMNSERRPSAEALSVPLRSNSILMSRVRESEFRELSGLRSSSALSGVMFLHLKKDLDVNHVDWIACQDPYAAFDDSKTAQSSKTSTSYGVPKAIQERLAGLRTDLDSFSNAEAYSLMLSGYRMASTEFSRSLPTLATNPASPVPWRFLSIVPVLDCATDRDADHEYLLHLLKTGAGKAFKAWRIWPAAKAILPQAIPLAVFLVISAIAVPRVIEVLGMWLSFSLPSLNSAARFLALPVAIVLTALLVMTILIGRGAKTLTATLTGLLMTTVGWFVARFHLWIIDPAFLDASKDLGDIEPPPRRNVGEALWRALLFFALAYAAVRLYLKPLSSLNFIDEDSPKIETEVIRNSALSDLQSGRWTEALRNYEKLSTADLTTSDLRGEAWALRESGRVPEAIALYQKILTAVPGDPRTEADLVYANSLSKRQRSTSVKIAGSVYIQLASAQQLATYERLKPLLENLGLKVLPEEVVGSNRSPGYSQVRYFEDTDNASAAQIADALQQAGVPTRVFHVPGYKTQASRGTFEIWLALPRKNGS
jgi:predicted acylesterase/phospholipase RssA